jgi:hypothetical protein
MQVQALAVRPAELYLAAVGVRLQNELGAMGALVRW